jgi:hypothetical protein
MELSSWSVVLSEELLLNNECSGSIKDEKSLDQVGDYSLSGSALFHDIM